MRKYRSWFKYVAILVVLATVMLRSDVQEISAMQDVAGISIDPGEGENYTFGLELSVTEKESSFTVNSKLMKVQAKTLSEALEQAGLRNEYPVVLTHGSLIVLHAGLVGSDLGKISKMLLEDWKGQYRTFITVADGCDAAEILKLDEKENLRAGLLSAQVRRAARQGQIQTLPAAELLSNYLRGDVVSMPLVALGEQSYRISGSLTVRRAEQGEV